MAEDNYLLGHLPRGEEKLDSHPQVGEKWTYDTGGIFRDTILLTKKLWWGRWEGTTSKGMRKISGGDLRQRIQGAVK